MSTAVLDVKAYLTRIGHRPVVAADRETLYSLHRAHTLAVPFENVDVVLGRTPALDVESLWHKLIESDRGGYCYEQNSLFAAVLERFGYRVTRSAARVNPAGDPPGPRTHMVSLTEIDGVRYLTDVGFGAGLLEPLPLAEGEYRQDGWTYRLHRDAEEWWLSSVGQDGEHPMYAFTGDPLLDADYEVFNHYTSTHPRSPFTGTLVAMRLTGADHTTLHGNTLRIRYPHGDEQNTVLEPGAHGSVLAERFGIRLTTADAAALRSSTMEDK